MSESGPKPEQGPDGRFQPGNNGGTGRPKGSRNKLGEDFLKAMSADFEAHGEATIAKMREEKPAEYVKVIAGLLPSEANLNINDKFEGLTDDQLLRRVKALTALAAPLLANATDADASRPATTH